MGQLVVSEMVSLDGVMQGPGGPEEDTEGGFKHGGWQAPLLDEESLSLITMDIGRMDALLLGRKTYDIFAAYWPKATTNKEIADKLNSATKYVASRSRRRLEWNNSSLIQGDLPKEVARIKQKTLLALRRSPKARFTWRTTAPGSPSTATCPSRAERTKLL
ncbi:hypothetical protein E6H12_11530 [Candidatus Bathyarchaeota archaeon]|nr:MAG: hypothetical protein E6H12_11530 [Candidatus Bathyarchaeota archaeon]